MEFSPDALRLMHLSSYGGNPLSLKKLSVKLDKVIMEACALPPELLIPGVCSTVGEFSVKNAVITRALYEAFDLLPPLPVPSPGYLRRKAQETARKHRAELRRRKR